MKKIACATLLAIVLGVGPALAGSVTLYSEPGFRGDRVTVHDDVSSLAKLPPWNDRARSVIVHSGTWEICKDKKYDHCQTFVGGARIADTSGVKNLRGGISSLREVGGDRHWGDGRWDDRGWDDDGWNRPPPPPVYHRRDDDGIIWNDGPGRGRDQWDASPNPTNDCQREVQRAFIQRYGLAGSSRFSGNGHEGTIWWEGRPWNYRCGGGQINIWQ